MVSLQRSPQLPVTLSVLVPCYNEEEFLRASIERLHHTLAHECTLEIILVDDCSRDASVRIAEALARQFPSLRFHRHPVNRGKGAALRTALEHATGDIVAIHDADMEYHPIDLKRMMHFMVEHKADVVFGTRFQPREARRVLYFWHTFANTVITTWCNMWTNLNLTDIECCYKMFTREVAAGLTIEDDRFGVEPELVSKCARMRVQNRRLRIFEMSVDYHGRTYAEGKKIGLRDGIRALIAIAKYNLPGRH